MKTTLVGLLCQCLVVLCLLMPSCAFYGHKAITAPCTHVIKTAKAPAGADAEDFRCTALYQDKEGCFYVKAWVCEAAKSYHGWCFDRIIDPLNYSWECVSAPKWAWVKLEKTSEKEYRILGICDKPANIRRVGTAYDYSWHIAKSEPFEVPCASWRHPLSYVCFAVVDVPVSVAANAVVIPCGCVVTVLSFTPISIPFRWLGEQCAGYMM